MNNLITFLVRYYLIFLFLFLEGFSLLLFFNHDRYQSSVVYNFSNEQAGKMYAWYFSVNKYFDLQRSNDSLLAENARLRTNQLSAKFIDSFKRIGITDTVFRQKYTYIPGRVINNSTNLRSNYLTLDIGSRKGIEKGLGVVTTSGIVGISREVSENFTAVLSILHKDFKVSAEVSETGNIGSVTWSGKDPRFVMLEIPPTQPKFKKDSVYHVVTSPYSDVFPRGVAIGTFTSADVNSDNFIRINVRLNSDLTNPKVVYVIRNILREEQKTVEEKASVEIK